MSGQQEQLKSAYGENGAHADTSAHHALSTLTTLLGGSGALHIALTELARFGFCSTIKSAAKALSEPYRRIDTLPSRETPSNPVLVTLG